MGGNAERNAPSGFIRQKFDELYDPSRYGPAETHPSRNYSSPLGHTPN